MVNKNLKEALISVCAKCNKKVIWYGDLRRYYFKCKCNTPISQGTIEEILKQASERAKQNSRRTLYARDL